MCLLLQFSDFKLLLRLLLLLLIFESALLILLVIKSSVTDATKHKNHIIDRFAYCMAYKYDMFADTMGDLGKLTGPKIFLCI